MNLRRAAVGPASDPRFPVTSHKEHRCGDTLWDTSLSPRPVAERSAAGRVAGRQWGPTPHRAKKGKIIMAVVPEFEFRTSTACTYNNSNPRCVEVATNVPGVVVVRSSVSGRTVEFTAVEWTDFLSGAKLGEFDLSA